MTRAEKMALAYGASLGGAALVSYLRGRRGFAEIGMDTVIHGTLLGTGASVVLYLQEDAAEKAEVAQLRQLTAGQLTGQAKENAGQKSCPPYGKIAKEGLAILSAINPEVLYKAAKLKGISIGPEGDDPMRVVLPKD